MKLLTAVPFSLYSSTSHVRHVDLCHLFIGWRNLLCPPALIPKKLVGIPVSGTPVNYPSSFWDRSLLAMFLCFHSFCFTGKLRGCIQKFPDRLPGARTANDIALCYLVQLYRHFVGQSSEVCHHNPLWCFQHVFVVVVVVYFVTTQSGNFWIHPRMLREEQVFDTKVLRKIFGRNKCEVNSWFIPVT